MNQMLKRIAYLCVASVFSSFIFLRAENGRVRDMIVSSISCEPTFYFVDVKYESPELTSRALCPDFLNTVVRICGVDTFIETGTYRGDTTFVASRIFECVHTIELSEMFFAKARKRFFDSSHVHVHQGSSPDVLRALLPTLENKKIMFWLDGHYSMGDTARGDSNCPILEELAAIKNAHIKDAVIVIDDARLFAVEEEWPSLQSVFNVIKDINPTYRIIMMGDVIFAYPEKYAFSVSPVLWACTFLRINALEPLDQKLVNIARFALEHSGGQERAYLKALHSRFASDRHYKYWYDLTLGYYSL